METITPYRYAELFENGTRWYIWFYVKNPDSGKLQRIRQYVNSQKSLSNRKRLALRMIKVINEKLDQGWNPLVSDSHKKMFTLLITALDEVLAYKLKYLRPRSHAAYKKRVIMLKEYIVKMGRKEISCIDFSENMAQDFMTMLLKSDQYNATTFNNLLNDYRTMWNHLIKKKHCRENVFRSIDLLPETMKRKRPFTLDESKIYRDYLNKYDKPFLITTLLCYYCGLRPKEIVELRIRDINLSRQLITVDPSISKNKKQRMIPVASTFWPLLIEYINNQDPNLYLVSRGYVPGRIKMYSTRISEHFRKIADKLGFDQDLKFYSLKDTCADQLDQAGYSTKTIRDLFGHSSISITDNYMKGINTRALDLVRDNFPDFG